MDNLENQTPSLNQLSEIFSKFSRKFTFMKCTKSNQTSFSFQIESQKPMYLIVEKQHIFILQVLQDCQPKAHKLTKGDKIQVQRLLKSSHAQSQVSLHQKLLFLSEITEVSSDFSIQNYQGTFDKSQDTEFKSKLNLNSHEKDKIKILKPNDKVVSFTKKINQKIEIHQPTKQLNSFNYIDLMQSSFEQFSNQDRNTLQHKNIYTNNIKNIKPKFIPKHVNSNVEANNKKWFPPTSKNKNGEYFNRSRQASEYQKCNKLNVNQLQKDKKKVKSRQIKFYSPPSRLKDSLEKKQNKKQTIEKDKNGIFFRQKRKQQLKLKDKQYFQKKEQIKDKIKNGKTQKYFPSKDSSYLFSNIKPFNNRISLQNQNDLQFLPRYNTLSNQNTISKIKENNQNEEQFNKNDDIYEINRLLLNQSLQENSSSNFKQKISQTLNNNSQMYLKKRIYQHMTNKFSEQNFTFEQKEQFKRKMSHQYNRKQNPIDILKNMKKKKSQNQKQVSKIQCPETINNYLNSGGFQIKISYAETKNL